MTINSITGRTPNLTAAKTAQKTELEGEKKVAAKGTEKTDSVAITTTTQEIKKAFGSSSVDTDRVNAVKKALADGSYSINAEKIAGKMIQFEKLMSKNNST
ncbi:MAG: flagellar biosynthesis anti-sigma factor FlgM [Methylobacter sp.]|jgi:negative regulator of flagellin synthesis FlgM